MKELFEQLKQAIDNKDKAATLQIMEKLTELQENDRTQALIMVAELRSQLEDDINQELLPLLRQALTTTREGNQLARELKDNQKIDELRDSLNS